MAADERDEILCPIVTSPLNLAFQCPECLRLQMIENAAWVAWLEVKGLKPMTATELEKRNAALSASYAAHFHRKKCVVVGRTARRSS
jgi:hypothetical protein